MKSHNLTQRQAQDQIADSAGYWDARLRSPDCSDNDRARFTAWRDSSADHRLAFERLQQLVCALREASARADVRGLREAATSATQYRRGTRAWAAIAASVALLAGIVAIWGFLPDELRRAPLSAFTSFGSADSYTTGFGQRSTVILEDGSSVELNARTRMEVNFDGTRRNVRLLEGQALFSVAKDARRPFVVRAGDRDIMAVGTAFDVRLDSQSVRVTLLEGKVNVDRSGHAAPHPQALVPGQQFIVMLGAARPIAGASSARSTRAAVVRPVDVMKVTGWRDGQVFLEDLALTDAVAEMNRYSRVRISVGDPGARAAASERHVPRGRASCIRRRAAGIFPGHGAPGERYRDRAAGPLSSGRPVQVRRRVGACTAFFHRGDR